SFWVSICTALHRVCRVRRSFTCVTNDNMSAYSLPDGGKLTMNVKYKVESPCWVYTSEDNQGNVKKQIVIKGIVVPFES
uniref:hypothetical protein n=1 Tax=Segatella hominis TaxID=2518605 RepID=UPI0040253638